MATKQVSVRLAAVGGKQVKAELIDIGTAGERSFQQLDRSARVSGTGLQNVGFQVQDFAVQVAGGTDATRALAQQLPQLLSGFGLLGVLVGTATAILIPLAGYLFSAGEAAQTTDESMKGLSEAVDAYKAAIDGAQIPTAELIEKYGSLSTAAREALESVVALTLANTATAADNRAAQLVDSFTSLREVVRVSDDGFTRSVETIRVLNDNYGLAAQQVDALRFGFEALATADGVEAQAFAAAELNRILLDVFGTVDAMPVPLRQAVDELNQLTLEAGEVAGENQRAASEAERMNAALADAYGLYGNLRSQAAALAAETFAAAQAASSLAYGRILNTGDSGPDQAARDAIAARPNPFGSLDRQGFAGAAGATRASGRRGGGGGGGGVSDDEREAQRIFEQTRTEAEKYATELARINELHDSGALSTDTFNRAMDQLKETTGEANDTAKQLNQSFADTFTSIITGSSSASEAISQLLGNLASQLASSAFDGFFGKGGVFGAEGIGGLLGGIFGGGKAGGGPVRAGMSYMVGENGPERITMGGNGYVTTNAELRRSATQGGGGLSIAIDARGAVEGVAEQIERRLRAFAPELIQQSVTASRQAAGRGR